jgi:nitrate/TMAO reductase-like tetraheme cytochrome c subunit
VFRHAAHFSLMGEQGCSTCHTLDTKADYARHFGANRDPAVFRSNFAPMAKNTCAACHQPQKAGESCLQCHNYHTGDVQNLHAKAAEFRAAVGVKQ